MQTSTDETREQSLLELVQLATRARTAFMGDGADSQLVALAPEFLAEFLTSHGYDATVCAGDIRTVAGFIPHRVVSCGDVFVDITMTRFTENQLGFQPDAVVVIPKFSNTIFYPSKLP